MSTSRNSATSPATAASRGPTRDPFFVHRALATVDGALRKAGVTAQPVLLAVSGGGDSMAMLELVSMLAPKLDLALHVACIDHGVRGEAASEVDLVRDAAAARGATFHATTIRTDRIDEDTLRRARHAALADIAKSSGCRWILLGHTSDDQIETIVFRFLRGAGLGGLAGMRPVRGSFVRPMLSIRRGELRRVLRERGMCWAEDATNTSENYARGRLRTVVLPAIESAFGAGALDHLLDVAPRWRDDESFLEGEAARLLERATHSATLAESPAPDSLDLATLAAAHPALRARALRQWLILRTAAMPSSRELAGIERWLDRRRGASKVDIAGAKLVQARGRLLLSAAESKSIEQIENHAIRDPLDTERPASGGATTTNRIAQRCDARACGPDALLPPSDGRVRFSRT
jgi:tRNA(Ile)-lysidine synthase